MDPTCVPELDRSESLNRLQPPPQAFTSQTRSSPSQTSARLSARRARVNLAAFGSLIATVLLLSSATAHGQAAPAQQSPAPIVRIRPRPQAPNPATAPPEAAPLVSRPAHPRPVNPQSLSGAPAQTGPSAATGSIAHPPTTPTTPHPLHLPVTSGETPAASKAPHAPTSSAQNASGTAEHPAAARIAASNTLNRTVIVLDPAHGAQDSGSRIGDNTLEKNVTLAFAFRLRSLLAARGFTVVLTRDSDAATEPNTANTPLTLDDRAGIANHDHPAACLLLHATGRGTGVHLYTSEIDPAYGEPAVIPWLNAQAAWVSASQQLEHSVSSALGRSQIALVSSSASVRPVDSLTCPALVLELAPENSDANSVNDAGYQGRVAAAIAGALVFWQNQVQPPAKFTTGPSSLPTHHHATAAPKPATAPQEPQP